MFFTGKLNRPLITSFWGSEIWEERSRFQRLLQKIILKNSQKITAVTEIMKKKIIDELEIEQEKIHIVKYFILQVDKYNITQNEMKSFCDAVNIPINSMNVTISYSSDKRHRHDIILNEISRLEERSLIENDIYFLIPLTYGNYHWKEKIKKMVATHPFHNRIRIIENKLTEKEIVILRKISNLFINLPTQDTFSATMLEHLAAGNIVITGKWLPYDEILRAGIFLYSIDEKEIINLSNILLYVIKEYQHFIKKCENNSKIINQIINGDEWLIIMNEGLTEGSKNFTKNVKNMNYVISKHKEGST